MGKTCLRAFAIGLFIFAALAGTSLGVFFLFNHSSTQLEQAKRTYAPPLVYLTAPEMGISLPVGSYFGVSATIMDRQGVDKVELWMDGSMVEQTTPGKEGTIIPFFVQFDPLIPSEGTHTLVVRAINPAGAIGDSLPLQVLGTKKPDQVYLAVEVEQAQSLEDIANQYQTSQDAIQQANPNLAGNPPQPGTTLLVPQPPANPPSGQQQANVPPLNNPPVLLPNIPMLQLQVNPIIPTNLVPLSGPFDLPLAPTELKASADKCMITLVWNDNADNETEYEVRMNGDGKYYDQVIATLKSSNSKGKAWYRFPAPTPGRLTFWVVAVNGVGKAPSNYVSIDVDQQCPDNLAPQLEIEAVSFLNQYSPDRFYCYISFNSKPAVRIPADKSLFIDGKAGPENIMQYAAGKNKLILPTPSDKNLSLLGRCLGWVEGTLVDMGGFSEVFPESSWDGLDKKIASGKYDITIRIRPIQGQTPPGSYGFDDPTLPAPYHLIEKRVGDETSTDPLDEYEWFWERELRWDWSGDPKSISGFTIYLNGKPYMTIQGANQRSQYVKLPAVCDQHLKWQVAAQGNASISTLSAPIEYDLPVCTDRVVAELTISALFLPNTIDPLDEINPEYNCEKLETYAQIYAAGQVRSFWGGNFFIPVDCHHNIIFSSYASIYQSKYKDPGPATFKLFIPVVKEPGLNSVHPISFTFGGKVWDHDDSTSDDLVASFEKTIWYLDYESLPKDFTGNTLACYETGKEYTDSAWPTSWQWCIKVYKEK